ncbi:MAG: outer membrane lipoprotein carrier protein LolA [Candidatus Acidiferrales bacterium]
MLKKSSHRRNTGAFAALALAMFFSAVGLAATQGQQHWTTESVLRQLDHEAKGFHSLTASIEQTKVTVAVNDKSTETGQISVRRDDKMRIEFTQPDARTILRSGNDLYVYNPKLKRVEEYDLGKHRDLVDQFLLLGFGTSGSELLKGYLPVMLGEETLDNRQVVKLELTPKSEEVRNQINKVHIWIDESTWLAVQQQFFETGGGDYFIIHYTNVVKNPNISDDHFKPRWPKGVTHVKP